MPNLSDTLTALSEPDLIAFYGECRLLAETVGCPGCSDHPRPELAAAWNTLAAAAYQAIGFHISQESR